jgi:hypothetical protein
MKWRPLNLLAGLIGLAVTLSLLVSLLRQAGTPPTPALVSWPPTIPAQPCTATSVFWDQRLWVERDLPEVAAALDQAWRDQGWQTELTLRADARAALLSARRTGQAFEANLLVEAGTLHLLAQGQQGCSGGAQP